MITQVAEALDESLRHPGSVEAFEELAAELAILDAVPQDVIDSSQHRGGHSDDCFLGPPARAKPKELGAIVAVLRPDRRPRGLNEYGFKPTGAFPSARRLAFASAFVEPGA